PGASKKLSSCVRPGVLEARARPRCRTSALNRVDLPTFDRPAKAISRWSSAGRNCRSGTLLRKRHGRANSASPAAISSRVNMGGGTRSGIWGCLLTLSLPARERWGGTIGLRAFPAAQDLARGVDPGSDGVIRAVEPALPTLALLRGECCVDLLLRRAGLQAQGVEGLLACHRRAGRRGGRRAALAVLRSLAVAAPERLARSAGNLSLELGHVDALHRREPRLPLVDAQVLPEVDLRVVAPHDRVLLQQGEHVVPGPIDHQAGRERRQ